MRFYKLTCAAAVALLTGLTLSSCERERRSFSQSPPDVSPPNSVRQSDLQPGSVVPATDAKSPYEANAYGISEGQRLFEWYNCSGCHSHGGGGMGPPLMDDQWIYGGSPQNIYATIVEGRPNGMPSFADKISGNEVWQIVAYVRSLSGQVRKDVAPSRTDDMSAKQPEQSKSREKPKPQQAEHDR
jgi:cytochrome c oxidase cbb3-type subunit 3